MPAPRPRAPDTVSASAASGRSASSDRCESISVFHAILYDPSFIALSGIARDGKWGSLHSIAGTIQAPYSVLGELLAATLFLRAYTGGLSCKELGESITLKMGGANECTIQSEGEARFDMHCIKSVDLRDACLELRISFDTLTAHIEYTFQHSVLLPARVELRMQGEEPERCVQFVPAEGDACYYRSMDLTQDSEDRYLPDLLEKALIERACNLLRDSPRR